MTSPRPSSPLLIDVPELLDGPRVRLRRFRRSDGPLLLDALTESLDAMRAFLWFLPWLAGPHTLETAEARCRQCEVNFLARTDLPYVMVERDAQGQEGRMLGSVGLHRTDWQLPRTEVGYWVRPSAGGRGHAAEGVRLLAGWALRELGAQRVELVTDELNTASRRVAERCGFTLEGIHRQVQRAPDGTLRSNCMYALLNADQLT